MKQKWKKEVLPINTSWRDEGARLLRLANELNFDRAREEYEQWEPDDPDYSHLRISIIYSPAFGKLNRTPVDVSDYYSLDDFARRVSDHADSIALKNYSADEGCDFCGALALASFLGYPPDGTEGLAALKRVGGGRYSVSGMTLRILARCAHQPVEDDFIECLMELDHEDITQITHRGARTVWLARRLLENLSLMTDEELKPLGGDTFAVFVMRDQIKDNDGGVIDGTEKFWEMDKLVDSRRVKPNPAEADALVEKYEAILADSSDDWDFIGKLLGLTPHREWEPAENVYRPKWFDDGSARLAVKRTAEAAIMGYPPAQRRLAELYETGSHGMKRDTEKARYWMDGHRIEKRREARVKAEANERIVAAMDNHLMENESPVAIFRAGIKYYWGQQDTPPDKLKAFRMISGALEKGLPADKKEQTDDYTELEAARFLAEMLLEDADGVLSKRTEPFWFEKPWESASQTDRIFMLITGRGGTERDLRKAHKIAASIVTRLSFGDRYNDHAIRLRSLLEWARDTESGCTGPKLYDW